ncbi:site-2 protease family protein [uncultured Treponema sp.]|uniref:M50 family metallopeptidase n=1 Tax=uncultured Treponema sp. TaxID=162155 RepID=UPI0025D602ED|nr:site-2 protease family protein [uncultured Treponema sp.]
MTIIIGILLLGILVFIHELGHFAAAKFSGVEVEAFSIGMGPVLLHKEWHGTDWRISLLPFGGYCAMKGEKDFEESFDTSIVLEKDSFYGVKAIFRAIIGFAGPFANFLFASFSFFVIALVGYTYYSAGNKIQLANEIYPELHSAAADAGLLTGDKIIKINNKEISDFSDLYSEVAVHGDEDISVIVERNGENLSFTIHTDLNKKTGEGKIGVVSDPATVEAREAKRYSFFPAIAHGFSETFRIIHLSFKGIASLFKGVDVKESVAGPARITKMMGDTAKTGFSAGFKSGIVSVLQLMALISVSLFIMNLLPVPILDGFLVLISLIEAIFGVRVSPKVRNIVQYIGIAFIAFLFLLAMTGDFHYFAGLLNVKK